MWTSTRGGEGLAHVDACGQRGVKNPIFVDVINGWPLMHYEVFISRIPRRMQNNMHDVIAIIAINKGDRWSSGINAANGARGPRFASRILPTVQRPWTS